ncbi:MAG: PD-(D/E)XK nuclease family protein [Saprospiraceae bacterium]
MPTFHLGLCFDENPLPRPPDGRLDDHYGGPRELLRLLEGYYGLQQPRENLAHLRTEAYRQVLAAHLAEMDANAFYAASFTADAPATAEDLLDRRDELIAAGWNLLAAAGTAGLPARLATLAACEQRLYDCTTRAEEPLFFPAGEADRLARLLPRLTDVRHPALHIFLHEPAELLPPALGRLLNTLAAADNRCTIEQLPEPAAPTGQTDLDQWRRRLRGEQTGGEKPTLRGDGSLLLVAAHRETHIAAWLAALLRRNTQWRPDVLMTVKNQTLDSALVCEGLPSMGVQSTSLARPSLQVLKLVPTFLWEPADVQAILQFVSLVVKPLNPHLGRAIATQLAAEPGLFGDGWFRMLNRFFEDELPRIRLYEGDLDPEEIRRQYEFWFRRPRYSLRERAPKADVRSLFSYLHQWALQTYEAAGSSANPTLLVLAAQAQRIVDLLDLLPEDSLGYLDVERVVRTIYEPAPAQFQPAAQGRLEPTWKAGSIHGPVDELIWWDFIAGEPDYFFSRWYPTEREFLAERGVPLQTPARRNDLLNWHRRRPVLHCSGRLLLCLPNNVDGTAVEPHPLLGDLEAAFGDLSPITFSVDENEGAAAALEFFQRPGFQRPPARPLPLPRPFTTLAPCRRLAPREQETTTSLLRLLHYPHQWVFSYGLRLRPLSLLSISAGNRLFGNLAHRVIERMLEEKDLAWTRPACHAWIDDNIQRLLEREGATLLEYGREPERVQFIQKMKSASWGLVQQLKAAGWSVRKAEQEVSGTFGGINLRGRADLVIERENECAVIDLKWRGRSFYEKMVQSGDDLQLMLYSELLGQAGSPAATAYFILHRGSLVTRDPGLFNGIPIVSGNDTPAAVRTATLARTRATLQWRTTQLAAGRIELRNGTTAPDLEDIYEDENLDILALLEPKTEDDRFDDYRTLVGLVK